jgi:hypothetical protein
VKGAPSQGKGKLDAVKTQILEVLRDWPAKKPAPTVNEVAAKLKMKPVVVRTAAREMAPAGEIVPVSGPALVGKRSQIALPGAKKTQSESKAKSPQKPLPSGSKHPAPRPTTQSAASAKHPPQNGGNSRKTASQKAPVTRSSRVQDCPAEE